MLLKQNIAINMISFRFIVGFPSLPMCTILLFLASLWSALLSQLAASFNKIRQYFILSFDFRGIDNNVEHFSHFSNHIIIFISTLAFLYRVWFWGYQFSSSSVTLASWLRSVMRKWLTVSMNATGTSSPSICRSTLLLWLRTLRSRSFIEHLELWIWIWKLLQT